MSSGTQVDLDWAGTDAGRGTAGAPGASASTNGGTNAAYLTDEEILGIDPPSPDGGFGGLATDRVGRAEDRRDGDALVGDLGEAGEGQNPQAEARATGGMPSWMAAMAADPRHGGEAQQLWREHQEFRAAFSSPEEARAVKELFPGGMRDVLSLREATQSVERIDAALFSGDARAQSEVVAEIARANPAAFRAMFAEAAKVLATMGARGNEAGSKEAGKSYGSIENGLNAGPTLRKDGEGWGPQSLPAQQLPDGNHESPGTNHPSRELRASQSPVTGHAAPQFDPVAYASFERSTNEIVARDVRGAIGDTLARVLPEGVADGAARRIGDDIFNEIHRALAADRSLSEQVGERAARPAIWRRRSSSAWLRCWRGAPSSSCPAWRGG